MEQLEDTKVIILNHIMRTNSKLVSIASIVYEKLDYLILNCADDLTARWLLEAGSILIPWEVTGLLM